VAEGVEEEDQLALLRAAECDLIQGYIFSHPLTAIEASCLLYQHSMKGSALGLCGQPSLLAHQTGRPGGSTPAWDRRPM